MGLGNYSVRTKYATQTILQWFSTHITESWIKPMRPNPNEQVHAFD
jgi:hypothetical protein